MIRRRRRKRTFRPLSVAIERQRRTLGGFFRRPVAQFWLERYLDTVEVGGSSPLGPTIPPAPWAHWASPSREPLVPVGQRRSALLRRATHCRRVWPSKGERFGVRAVKAWIGRAAPGEVPIPASAYVESGGRRPARKSTTESLQDFDARYASSVPQLSIWNHPQNPPS